MPVRKTSSTTRPSSQGKGKPPSHAERPSASRFQVADWLRCLGRYTALVTSSLSLSTVLFSLSTQITRGDLAWTSRHFDFWWQIGGLLVWRTIELTVTWLLGYDARDAASFTYLTHLPTYILLYSFYGIRPTTLLTVASITVLSTALPFLFLRNPSPVHQQHPFMCLPCSGAHAASKATRSTKTTRGGTKHSNPTILTDCPTTVYTTLVAACIYTVILYASLATWLPTYLVTYYDGLPDLRNAHMGPKGFISLLVTLLPAGYALRDFLFLSSIGVAQLDQQQHKKAVVATEEGAEADVKAEGKKARSTYEEDFPGEFLVASLYRRYWLALPSKTRVLVSRTAALATIIMLNTIVQVVGTISGAEIEGAVGWGAIWTLATCVTGVLFGWVEAVDGL
ncbi:hypothetical protein AJ78_01813 [Emergomyces pasteurianus Ep9510]|uniref:Uncharacterized protein n=1 Tax=Emergomyces pasteurianus Ep9510 TaxID=1447872 RepID=A0A1J9QD78_9EURO|nr:hypothetical protein AJ78_01813 [Emergomyces pasteurianus Ep9510]